MNIENVGLVWVDSDIGKDWHQALTLLAIFLSSGSDLPIRPERGRVVLLSYSRSPAASRASAHSPKYSIRTILPLRKVATWW